MNLTLIATEEDKAAIMELAEDNSCSLNEALIMYLDKHKIINELMQHYNVFILPHSIGENPYKLTVLAGITLTDD